MTDDASDTPGSAGPMVDGGVDGLLESFLSMLPISGVSISVAAGAGHSVIGASDDVAAQLERLQFELGEGPHWDALRSGEPVLVPELGDRAASWPVFAAAAADLPVRALFSVPLTLGAAVVGVVDLHRATPGPLSRNDIAAARSLAVFASAPALRLAARAAHEEEPSEATAPELRRVVHQATGMLIVQLGVGATEAFARLRAHAFASGRPLESVAQDVVARRLTFDDRAAAE